MLNDEQIKKIFLECENNNPAGLYPTDIDILEFGRKLVDRTVIEARKVERQFCVQVVSDLNSEVAKVLDSLEVSHVVPSISEDRPPQQP